MTLERLYAVLTGTGIPVFYLSLHGPQAPPYIAYSEAYTRPVAGGDEVRAQIVHYDLHLYTKGKDPATEHKVEEALRVAEIVYEKSEEGIDDAKVVDVLYEFEEVTDG